MRVAGFAALAAAFVLVAAPAAGEAPETARAAAKRGAYDDAARILRGHLAGQPGDEDARFLLARVLAWQGKHAQALREYSGLLKAAPDNADYLLGKAQTYIWSGEPERALPLLRRARRLALHYEDVWRAQISALIALGDPYRMEQAATIQREARSRFPRSKWDFPQLAQQPSPDVAAPPPAAVAAAPPPAPVPPAAVPRQPAAQPAETPASPPSAAPPPRPPAPPPAMAGPGPAGGGAPQAPALGLRKPAPATEAEFGFTREAVTRGLPEWRSVYAEAVHRFDAHRVLQLGVRETNRFGLADTEAYGGLYFPVGAQWTGIIEGSASPSANVLAKYALGGQLLRALPYGWSVGAGLRHSEFTHSGVDVTSLLAERYWGNFRVAYTLYSGRPEGAGSSAAHRFQLIYHYGERDHVGLAYTTGRESENAGPPVGVITSEVRNWALSGRHWLSGDWALSYELVEHEQGDRYRRRGLRLGIRHGF